MRNCFEHDMKTVYEKYNNITDSIDFSTIANCYVYIIGGCFISLGLKYAGSLD